MQLYLLIAVCGYGTYSPTGLVPCLQCPSNTYTGDPPIDGFKECFKCPANTYTYSPGSKESSDCRGNVGSFNKLHVPFFSVCTVLPFGTMILVVVTLK